MQLGQTPPPPSGDDDWTAWIAGIALTIGMGLVAAVKFLFSKVEATNAATLKDHGEQIAKLEARCDKLSADSEECVRDRETLRVQVGQLETEIRFLKDKDLK